MLTGSAVLENQNIIGKLQIAQLQGKYSAIGNLLFDKHFGYTLRTKLLNDFCSSLHLRLTKNFVQTFQLNNNSHISCNQNL